jgi:uncharacterized protein YdcH (DUF465 family)
MTADSSDLRTLLIQTDGEFRQLATRHRELEDRLHELTDKQYLSEPEQVEEVTLKKRKLQLKDRMEDIIRQTTIPADDVPSTYGATLAPHRNAR